MAMRKEPERRYRSVRALASDVSAYLEMRPIAARGGGWRYRAGIFVRRHKLVAASLTLLVLSSISFTIAMTVQLRHTDRERVKASRAAEFLAEMFRASTPQESRGRTITARGLLDRGSQRFHHDIGQVMPVNYEMAIALPVHYAIGITLTLACLLATSALGLNPGNPFTAVGFGLTTNVLPWLVMLPAMGYGWFGAHGPGGTRLFISSLINHCFYGLGLWIGASLLI
jgi:hypothetical protein